jgi:hypothetical protein
MSYLLLVGAVGLMFFLQLMQTVFLDEMSRNTKRIADSLEKR